MAKSKKEFEYEYDPIKEIKGGEKAKAVVWSTKSLEAAVDGLSKGLPLKANPFIGPNTKLLKPDLVYKRTKEELEKIGQGKEITDIFNYVEDAKAPNGESLKELYDRISKTLDSLLEKEKD